MKKEVSIGNVNSIKTGKISMNKSLRNLIVILSFFALSGCQNKDINTTGNSIKIPMYLLYGETSGKLKVANYYDGSISNVIDISLINPFITKYTEEKFSLSHDISLKKLVALLDNNKQDVFAVFSENGTPGIAVAKIKRLDINTESSFSLLYHDPYYDTVMLEKIYDGRKYAIRFITIPKGYSDSILVAGNGAEITPLEDGRFNIVLKNIKGAFNIYNIEDRDFVEYNVSVDKLKKACGEVSDKYRNLNGDIFVDTKKGIFASFQVKSCTFTPKDKALKIVVDPLQNESSKSFFEKHKEKTVLNGIVKLHV